MADNFKFVAGKEYTLYGSGITSTATSLVLTSFADRYGNLLTMNDFGTIGYLSLEPGTSKFEIVSFTGITQNADGTATITGLTRGLKFKAPYDADTTLRLQHSGSAPVKISNPPQFYDKFANKEDDETINSDWTFSSRAPSIPTETSSDTGRAASIGYVNGVAIAGGVDSSTTVKGISKLSVAPASATDPIAAGTNDPRIPTQAENDSLVGNNTSIAVGTNNKMVTQTGLQNKGETYATSTGSTNAYVLTLSPVPTALVAGQEFEFKANFTNTSAATLNVNSLGAIAIKKDGSIALVAGDITSGQIYKVKYDGTNFQLISPNYNTISNIKTGNTTIDLSSTTATTIAHGLGKTPRFIEILFVLDGGTSGVMCRSEGYYDGTTQNCLFSAAATVGGLEAQGMKTTKILWFEPAAGGTDFSAVASMDATNITLTKAKTGSPTGTGNIIWKAYA